MLAMPALLSPDVFSRRRRSSREVTFMLPPLLSPDLFRRRSSSAAELRAGGGIDGSTTPLTPSSPRDVGGDYSSRHTTPSPVGFVFESPKRTGLGRLNPDIYRLPSPDTEEPGVDAKATLGRLWFSLAYDASEEKLTVTVIKAQKLPQRSRDESDSCDPVVRVHLLPDKRRYLQSQQKRNTCCPRFDEDFSFMIPQRRLAQHSIRISVHDSRRDRKHLPLGCVTHSLRAGHTVTNMVRDICRPEAETEGACGVVAAKVPAVTSGGTVGGVLVGLTFNAGLERLNVAILEAVELDSVTDEELPSTFTKVTMYHHTRGLKSKRTDTVRECSNPKYAESFNMSLPADNLSEVHIRIQVKQKMHAGKKDVTLGRVTIGSHMFARGAMQQHWEKMLQNPKEQIQMWHVLKAI